MRYISLVTIADEYDNTPGFKLASCPDFEGFMACRTGASIAHDLVEHQNGPRNMGPVWDELEALGGVWYCRGQFGFPDNRHSFLSPETHTASDISYMWEKWSEEYTPASAWSQGRPHYEDETFQVILDTARETIISEAGSDWDEEGNADDLASYLDLALQCLRRGYRKAERRWSRDFDGMYAYRTYKAIAGAVSAAVPHIEIEGQEFILGYGDGKAVCHPRPIDWEGY